MRTLALFVFFGLLLLTHSDLANAQSTVQVSIKFYIGDQPLDASQGVALGDVKKLVVKIVPDSEAMDVKYDFRWNLYIRSGTNLSAAQSGSHEALYPGILGAAKPGDTIELEIEHLARTDASGNREEMKLTSGMKYLEIAVRK